jgi:AraC-like DNA-binding protein
MESTEPILGLHTLLLVIGLVQGLFLGMSLVLHGRKRTRADILLGLFVITYSLMLIDDVLFETRLLLRFPYWTDVFSLFIFLPAPLIYLYVRSMTNPERPIRRGDLVHAIPFLLLAIFTMPEYFAPFQARLIDVRQMYQADRFYFNLAIVLPLTQLIGYFVAIAVLLARHTGRVNREFSSLSAVSLRWVRWFLTVYLLVAVTWMVSYCFRWSFGLQVLDLAFLVGVYAFGYRGWSQPPIPATVSSMSSGGDDQPRSGQTPKYAKSALTPEQMLDIQNRLLAHLEGERPFLDPELSLSMLAGQLDVLPHNLSRIINESLNTTFFNLINGFRVREAQRLLSDPCNREMKVLAVAFEAGFKSKSAFNAAFRYHTGLTPSAFRDRVFSSGPGNHTGYLAA